MEDTGEIGLRRPNIKEAFERIFKRWRQYLQPLPDRCVSETVTNAEHLVALLIVGIELCPRDRPADVGDPRALLKHDRIESRELPPPEIRRAAKDAKASEMESLKPAFAPSRGIEESLGVGFEAARPRLEKKNVASRARKLDRSR